MLRFKRFIQLQSELSDLGYNTYIREIINTNK